MQKFSQHGPKLTIHTIIGLAAAIRGGAGTEIGGKSSADLDEFVEYVGREKESLKLELATTRQDVELV